MVLTCSVLSPPSNLICPPLVFSWLVLLPARVLPFWRRSLCAVPLPSNRKYVHSVVTIRNYRKVFQITQLAEQIVGRNEACQIMGKCSPTASRKELLGRNPCWSCSSLLSASLPLDLPRRSPPSIGTSPTLVEESLDRNLVFESILDHHRHHHQQIVDLS